VALPIQLFGHVFVVGFTVDVSFSHNAQRLRRTDGQTDDIIMTIADHRLRRAAVRSAKNRE